MAMELGKFSLGEECLKKAKDFQGLLLYYSCINNREKLSILAEESELNGFNNVAYTSYFMVNNVDKCLEILIKSKRFSEAALFCRTYCPNKISEALELWNNELNSDDQYSRIAQNVINPIDNLDEENLMQMEKTITEYYNFTKDSKPTDFNNLVKFNDVDLESYLAENGDINFDFSKLLEDGR